MGNGADDRGTVLVAFAGAVSEPERMVLHPQLAVQVLGEGSHHQVCDVHKAHPGREAENACIIAGNQSFLKHQQQRAIDVKRRAFKH